MNIFRKGVLATTLAASTIVLSATPASARDYYRDRGDDTAAIAIGAGILGLAVGAIAASDGDRRYRNRDRRYYDRRYDRSAWNDGRYYRRDRYYDRDSRYDGYRYGDRGSWYRGYGDRSDWQRYNGYRGGYNDRYYYRRGW